MLTDNVYWDLWFVYPAITMLLATIGRRRKQIIIGTIISSVGSVCLLVLAVTRMWELRMLNAVTPEQIELASSDGANLVFTFAFVGPVSALITTSIWGAIGYWLAGRIMKKT